ncbi:MAG: hypothetical protein R3B13_17345 [Polyangiaceae bacterium]
MASRTFFAFLAACALLPAACDLNPQPEVPSGATGGVAATAGGGGAGATLGMGGSNGGSGAVGGAAGSGMGGSTSSGGQGGFVECSPACDAGEICNAGACTDDPCDPNTCDAKQACKPNADFSAAGCFDSCAGVNCAGGQVCMDGTCVATGCPAACAPGEVCLPRDGGYECVADPCLAPTAPACGANQVCDPAMGACAPDPCTGVKCPADQLCAQGECVYPSDAGDAG